VLSYYSMSQLPLSHYRSFASVHGSILSPPLLAHFNTHTQKCAPTAICSLFLTSQKENQRKIILSMITNVGDLEFFQECIDAVEPLKAKDRPAKSGEQIQG